ncbi:MAG TPA: UDP-glucose/GDP-mannose dehydrogenase family protein [Candidatus Acidoferrales bacterium]|nr:UDP-glucose/GDP-mannose dehydrogenase family protein [Candidatus Acidoferrales bacterium]
MKICVIGSGYVGLVAALCFAELGHDVISCDSDESKVRALQEGVSPIYEDLLPELLARHGNARVKFTTDLRKSVRDSAVIFIAVGTPQSANGEADLSYVEAVVHDIAGELKGFKVIVEKSTVPVTTSQWIRRALRLNGADPRNFEVVSNPEFLREGTAVIDFLYPDRIVVGCDSGRGHAVMREIYKPLIDGSYYMRANRLSGPPATEMNGRYIETSAKSAELIKHASNAFLATKISFINMVSTLCEVVGTDIAEVADGMGADSRIGARFLNAGIGYGGSCFPKDIRAFCKIAENNGCDFSLLQCVEDVNSRQRERFLHKITHALWNLKGKTVGVLGTAFKGGTDDVRESPAIEVIRSLLAHGCTVQAYDPAALEKTRELVPPSAAMKYAGSAYQAAQDAHAVVIATEWREFAELDLRKLHGVLAYPIVVDGRNLYDPDAMAEAGFYYYSMGRPDAVPKPAAEALRIQTA